MILGHQTVILNKCIIIRTLIIIIIISLFASLKFALFCLKFSPPVQTWQVVAKGVCQLEWFRNTLWISFLTRNHQGFHKDGRLCHLTVLWISENFESHYCMSAQSFAYLVMSGSFQNFCFSMWLVSLQLMYLWWLKPAGSLCDFFFEEIFCQDYFIKMVYAISYQTLLLQNCFVTV